MEAVRSQQQAGAGADESWLPDLIEIGGFHYESGCREFTAWAQVMRSIVGESGESMLPEIWQSIPRSAAEKFGTMINGVNGDSDRIRIAMAYKQLNFRPAGPDATTAMLSSLANLQDTGPVADSGTRNLHHHTCRSCGMPFSHDAWECEPPDDEYCHLCSEQISGPMPVWIERWAENSGPSGEAGPGPIRPALASESKAVSPDTQDAESPNRQTIPEAVAAQPDDYPSVPEACDKPAALPIEAGGEAQSAAAQPRPAVVLADDILTRTPSPVERGFGKVAGMHELKKLLYEEVISALRDPDDLKAYGLSIPNGILLFGPPGCGKTYISRQLAEEMNYFFKEIFPSEIGSTFIHETTLKIREVFDFAYQHAPSIIFIDEFESMVPARKNLGAHQQHTAEEVSEFLKQLEACADRKILLIAATNEPWKIDPAVQRTGRLDKKIYVGPPDKNARAEMLRFHLYGRRMCEIDVVALAESLAGYSASDLKLLVDEAARLARKQREPISEAYLRVAAKERVAASVTVADEQKYLAFGQRGVKAQDIGYVVKNSILPGRQEVDLVHKWGRGRQAVRDSSRSKL